jgi:hypothetical protein
VLLLLLLLLLLTQPCRFIFKDQYIELSTRLAPDTNLYGIGEVSLPSGLQLPRDGTTLTLWARDMPSANPYANLYGSHPFCLQLSAGRCVGKGPDVRRAGERCVWCVWWWRCVCGGGGMHTRVWCVFGGWGVCVCVHRMYTGVWCVVGTAVAAGQHSAFRCDVLRVAL